MDDRTGHYFAHTLDGVGPALWEPLESHLEAVAERATYFATAFNASTWAHLAGRWHDLGKYAPAFQQYLRTTASLANDDQHRAALRGSVDHATAGALYAARTLGLSGLLLAYAIAGHHGGLPNTVPEAGETTGLRSRLSNPPSEALAAIEAASGAMQRPDGLLLPSFIWDPERASFQVAQFVRMVFSCLVDADFLATELFMSPHQARRRPMPAPAMAELTATIDNALAGLRQRALDGGRTSAPVHHWRNRVLDRCLEAADRRPGLFSLTVPTGGGKTLSSLAFAMHHAQAHDLRRVIVAIPFTSIIEQNADVYRWALGEHQDLLIEHHSNLDPQAETERNRLAAENWDAPLIVTTNVQLLESLFADRPGRCRKLHRIARSVIILDEAQALPPNLLKPTLWALRELVENYGCTVVLCTATQPALEKPVEHPDSFPIGLEAPRPIVPTEERAALFTALKRVTVEQHGVLSDAELADQLADELQVLCVVNTRAHSRDLFTALSARLSEPSPRSPTIDRKAVGSCLHLSANMCPRHRTATLRLIRRRLRLGLPCRVVSTQLIEAGVDVDFPVVYRAMSGLDAIAQAAGRCNREGKLEDLGRVIIFEPDPNEHRVPSFAQQGINATKQVTPDHDDPLLPEAQYDYFRLYYWDEQHRSGWDRPPNARPRDPGVLACFADGGGTLQFREAAKRYRLIADDQLAVLIPYGRTGRALTEQLRAEPHPPDRAMLRRLQRFVVNVPRRMADALLNNQVLWPPQQTHEQFILANPAGYDRLLGLINDAAGWDPEQLTV